MPTSHIPKAAGGRVRWPFAVAFWLVCVGGCAEGPASMHESAKLASETGLRAMLGGGDGEASGFAKADRVIAFSFPRDHGAHPQFRSEWWYLTALLANAEGREFGVQFTVFRRGIAPVRNATATEDAAAWRTGQVYLGHLAVSDIAERRHMEEERLARGHPALAGARASPFAVYVEGWRLAAAAGGGRGERTAAAGGGRDERTAAAGGGRDERTFWPLRLQAGAARFQVDLVLRGTKPIVRQGERGLSRKGPDNASYYYSIPRIEARGRVVVEGTAHTVTGRAWLDREWSTSVLAPDYAGWDWFALGLDDGRDLMVYRMRRHDGQASGYDSGALVSASGDVRILGASEFALTAEKHWREWPIAWRLTLRGEPLPWTVRAAFADQVMETSIRYWEGVVHVRDANGRRIGAGYMELTGY